MFKNIFVTFINLQTPMEAAKSSPYGNFSICARTLCLGNNVLSALISAAANRNTCSKSALFSSNIPPFKNNVVNISSIQVIDYFIYLFLSNYD